MTNLSDPKFSTTAVSRLQIRQGLLRGCLHIGACFMCVFSIQVGIAHLFCGFTSSGLPVCMWLCLAVVEMGGSNTSWSMGAYLQ